VVRLAKAHICPRVSLGNPDDIRMGYSLAVSIPAGVKVVSKIFLYNSVKRESSLGSDKCCFQASLRLHFYFISNSTLYQINNIQKCKVRQQHSHVVCHHHFSSKRVIGRSLCTSLKQAKKKYFIQNTFSTLLQNMFL